MNKMNKLHKILVIVFVVVAAGSIFFSASYRQAEAKQPKLQDEINMAIMQLSATRDKYNLEPLKQQLSELQAEIDLYANDDEPLFPRQAPSVEVGDLIVDSVDKFKLELLKLLPHASAGTRTIKSDADSQGNKYSVAEYDVKVKGRLGRINSLISAIEGATFATLVIEDMDISLIDEDEELNITDMWEAEFTVVNVYQYTEKK